MRNTFNGNMTKDLDRNICKIQYNVLNLPSVIQFRNGNQIVHVYDAMGNRVKTTYYTRKATAAVTVGNILNPEDTITKYYVTKDGFNGNVTYKNYSDIWYTNYVHNPEGYMWDLSIGEFYPCYYIKDHLGNIRETWIYPAANYKVCMQKLQYYPSGLPWNMSNVPSQQPYKYNGKEFVEMHGLDEYDSRARWYYPAIMRTTTMDPLCEKYYDTSPYAWCENNAVRYLDLNGDSIVLGENPIETILAIYNGLPDNCNITLSFNNRTLNPNSFENEAQRTDDPFVKDLHEIAINPQIVEINTSYKNKYYLKGKQVVEDFMAPYDYNISIEPPVMQQELIECGMQYGITIMGNLGQTLFPGIISPSGKSSMNKNIQIIVNGKGSVNHQSVGLAHEFGHVILFLRGLPYAHGEKGVNSFIDNRQNIIKNRLGYDY